MRVCESEREVVFVHETDAKWECSVKTDEHLDELVALVSLFCAACPLALVCCLFGVCLLCYFVVALFNVCVSVRRRQVKQTRGVTTVEQKSRKKTKKRKKKKILGRLFSIEKNVSSFHFFYFFLLPLF